MMKQLFMSSAVIVFALVGPASGQELASRGEPAPTRIQILRAPASDGLDEYRALEDAFGGPRQLRVQIPASVDGDDADAIVIFAAAGRALGPTAQIRHSVPDFTANFDRAAQTVRPAPLAPGSAEIP
jgi:hypothetical protein